MDDIYITLGATVVTGCLVIASLVVIFGTPDVECERRVPEPEGKGGAWDFGLEKYAETDSGQRGTE